MIQRGRYRQATWFSANDYCRYLHWLAESAAAYGRSIYAYVSMINYIHLVMTPADRQAMVSAVRVCLLEGILLASDRFLRQIE